MNRNYKVIWNVSLNCFMAVAEYAKSHGKSSGTVVSSGAGISNNAMTRGARNVRLSALCIGFAAAGFSMQSIAAPCVGTSTVLCGDTAIVSSAHGIAIGKNATSTGIQAIAIGSGGDGAQNTNAFGDQSIAIGANVVSKGLSSIAIGGDDLDAASKANTNGSASSTVLNKGTVNTVFKDYAGRDIVETGNYVVTTASSGAGSIAIGTKSLSKGDLSTAIGVHSSTGGIAASAFGVAASAVNKGSVALGAGAQAKADEGVALGSKSVASISGGALGFASIGATLADKSAIGATNSINLGAVSVGTGEAGGNRQIVNVAAGSVDSDAVNVAQLKAVDNQVNKGIKFNVNNASSGGTLNKTFGLGQEIKLDTDSNLTTTALATGDGIKLGLANIINVGSEKSITINGNLGLIQGLTNTEFDDTLTYNSGQAATEEQLQLVSKGINSTVSKGINFGNGTTDNNFKLGDTISVTGDTNLTTEATAKGVQVKLNKDLNLGATGSMQIGDSRINGDSFYFNNSDVKLSSTGLNNGGNKLTNVKAGEALTDAVNVGQLQANTSDLVDLGLNFTGDDAAISVNRKLGDKFTIKGGATADLTNNNIGVVADEDGNLNVKLAKDLNLGATGSMQIGDSRMNGEGFSFQNSRMNGDGFYFSNSDVKLSNTGLNNGGNKLTNVKAGEALTDAVNVGQLNDLAATANKGWNISAQGDKTSNVAPGAAVDFNSKNGNITVSKDTTNNDISFELNKDLTVDSVKAGDTTIDNDGLTIAGGPSVTKEGINAADNKITNVKDGSIAIGSKDAINGGQLQGVINSIEDIETNVEQYDGRITDNKDRLDAGLKFGADNLTADINKPVGNTDALRFEGGSNITTTSDGSNNIRFDLKGDISLDSVTTGDTVMTTNGITIKDGPSLTKEGIDAANKKITSVNNGSVTADSRDAINGSQLFDVNKRLGDSINQLGYKINEVEDNANAGISAAMAMSSLPQANIAGRSMIGGGIATYNGESAVAVGVSRVSDNGRWVMKINGTADTQGNAGGAIGAGFHF